MTSRGELEANLRLFGPRALMRVTLGLLQGWADVVGRAAPGREARAPWVEFQNKLETFSLFEHVDAVLHLGSGPRLPLHACVARAGALDPFSRVWACEGIGHYYAEQEWGSGREPMGLLTDVPDDERAIPLHAGMGLSIATRVLEPSGARRSHRAMIDAVDRCLSLCEGNARRGYLGVAVEAMGLAARTLYPDLVGAFGDAFARWSPEWTPYFWHGVGRGVYFTPSTALPILDSHGRSLEILDREAPDDQARASALAGLAWALTLVNLRHPEVMETFLAHHGSGLDPAALANGAQSALVLWLDAAPEDSSASRFIDHTPLSGDVQEVWSVVVRGGGHGDIARRRERLRRDGRLGDLFHFSAAREDRHEPANVEANAVGSAA